MLLWRAQISNNSNTCPLLTSRVYFHSEWADFVLHEELPNKFTRFGSEFSEFSVISVLFAVTFSKKFIQLK